MDPGLVADLRPLPDHGESETEHDQERQNFNGLLSSGFEFSVQDVHSHVPVGYQAVTAAQQHGASLQILADLAGPLGGGIEKIPAHDLIDDGGDQGQDDDGREPVPPIY